MSCNYADGLSPYHDKGQLGLEEKFDSKTVVSAKVSLLTKWISEAKHVVIHTGAGISTSAGIPDFRGPKGVWTLEAKGEKPDSNKDFNEAIPTITHMAITKLVEKGKVKFVVSQNIDGLHLRSNLPRKYLSELHGNMFTEQCSSCNRQFVRSVAVPSVGQKNLNKSCPTLKANGRPCRGRLHDTILDWEHNLPENDLGMADYHSCLADLSICLGTTMQIVPSGNLPLYTKKHGGKLVIVNLQPTKHDKKADLLIHAYVDEVMTMLMKNLGIKIPKYSSKNDPTRTLSQLSEKFLEWTISDYAVKKMKKIYEEKCGSKEAKKRLEMIEDDIPVNVSRTFKKKDKDEDDSDLEVVDVIVKRKRGRESKKGQKKNSPPVYNTTITIKKVQPPPPKKAKYEGTEKITIKKNVTPTKTKYEIVTKPKIRPKCEIVYDTESDLCNDLDMICESDDDEMTNNFTYNFKRYLYEDVKKEAVKEEEVSKDGEKNEDVKTEIKNEVEDEKQTKQEVKEAETGESDQNVKEENIEATEKSNNEETDSTNKSQSTTDIIDAEEKEGKNQNSSKIVEKTCESSACNSQTSPASNEVEKIDDSSTEDKNETSQTPSQTTLDNECQQEVEEPKNESTEANTTESTEPTENLPAAEIPVAENKQSPLVESNNTEEKKSEDNQSPKDEKSNRNEEDKESSDKKEDNGYPGIESELSNLSSNSNLESQIAQMVNQTVPSQFDTSLEISNCNANSSVNENFEFYGTEYNPSNNSSDLDYVENNFYNNF